MADTSSIKDLTQQPPRGPRERIHGYAIIARTIDKCRASLVGKLGDYHYDCPLDNMLFGFKGVSGDAFKVKVQSSATDEDIAMWFDQAGKAKLDEEVKAWSDEVEAYKPYDDPEKKDWFIGECEALGLDPKTSTLFDYLEADDAAFAKK